MLEGETAVPGMPVDASKPGSIPKAGEQERLLAVAAEIVPGDLHAILPRLGEHQVHVDENSVGIVFFRCAR